MRPVPTSELELLLLCARVHVDAGHALAISRVTERGVDWDAFVALAQRHDVHPLVYRTLAGTSLSGVPRACLATLQSLHESNRVRNLILTGELLAALRALDASGIVAVPHKGPVLAAAIYGDFSARYSIDFDVRVKARDAVAARRVLIGLGYEPLRRIPERAQSLYVHVHCEFAFKREAKVPIAAELHWRNAPWYFRFPEFPESAWTNLARTPLAGVEVLSFAPAHVLFDLCVHGCKHKWRSLKWIVDIAEFLRTYPDLDWLRIMHDARDAGAGRMLALGIFLAHDLLDAHVPSDLAEAVRRERSVVLLADDVYENLFAARPHPGHEVYYLPFVARAAERLDTRVACATLALGYLVLNRATGRHRPARRGAALT